MSSHPQPIASARLDFDAATGPTLTVEYADQPPERYEVLYSVCPSPTCGCASVDLVCSPEAESSKNDGDVQIRCDVTDRMIVPATGRLGGESPIEKAVAESLTSEQWSHLREALFVQKRRLMGQMDLDKVEVFFPPELFVDPTMVGYQEIFPFAESCEFTIADQRWLAEDLHCLEPGCSCNEAMFCFYPMPEKGEDLDGAVKIAAAVRFNLKSCAWETEPDPIVDDGLVRELTRGLEESRPDLLEQMKERRRQLRYLFAKALDEHAQSVPQTVVKDPKVGRNQLCPCGSGKKYKKCCGR